MNIDFTTSLNMQGLDAARFKPLEALAEGNVDRSNRVNMPASALTVTTSEPLPVDELDDISEKDLRRDDDLGRLVMSAFDFKPPEMPEFV